MFMYTGVTYWVIRHFGSEAQAGFGIGARVMQGIFLPAMAIAFAVAPVAGQNFGARHPERVRETFRTAVVLSAGLMVALTLLCQWRPEALIRIFSQEPAVVEVGAQFLRIISWNFVAQGIIFSCSSLFQALGNTVPSLISSATRLVSYAVPAIWLTSQADFRIEQVWHLSVATIVLQTIVSLLLLRAQLRTQLGRFAQPQQA
jgi:Na+-driven multidrug efflux pump